jgi:hypothetical protein
VAGQLMLLFCATLLTIRVTLKQTPAHQNLFSPFSGHPPESLTVSLASSYTPHRSSLYSLLFLYSGLFFLISLGYPRKKGFTRETKLKDGPE